MMVWRPSFFHWQLSRDSRCVFRVWAAGLSVCSFSPGALNACRRNLQKIMPRQEPGAARTILKEDWQTWKKLKPLQSWPTSICIWLPAATFKKIPGSKQALWMPTPIFKNTGFKAGALNAQLPFSKRYWVESGRFECPTPMYGISCKESESTLSQGIRTWKDCDRGESDSSTRAVRQKVWNGSETALKLNVRSPSTARWVKKLESSLEGGAESSLAALRKNVSNGIEMILLHRQETPNSAADRKSIWKLQASAATETVAD